MTDSRYTHSSGFLAWIEQHFVGAPELDGGRRQRLWRWETTEGYDYQKNWAVGNSFVVAKYLTSARAPGIPESGDRQKPVTYQKVNDAAKSIGLAGGTAGDPGDDNSSDWFN